MGWASMFVKVVFAVCVMSSLVMSQNHPLKFFRLYLKNTLTNEVRSCFPKDYSMTDINSVSDVFDSYKDRQNFVFGFDGPNDLEFHDCSGDSGFNLDLTVWGCFVDIIRNADADGQAIWQAKLDFALCDHNLQTGLVPDNRFLIRFFDDREFGKTQVSTDFFDVAFERVTSGANFRDMIRYETNYSTKFGPPNFEVNKMELNINIRRNLALDFEIQANIPVFNYNYCVDARRCLEALYAGMDAPSWICPFDPCPPGYKIYKDDVCYLSLVNDQFINGFGNAYRLQVPAFNTTMPRLTGVRDCLDRNVDPFFCYNRVYNMIENCARYPEQNYAFTLN